MTDANFDFSLKFVILRPVIYQTLIKLEHLQTLLKYISMRKYGFWHVRHCDFTMAKSTPLHFETKILMLNF